MSRPDTSILRSIVPVQATGITPERVLQLQGLADERDAARIQKEAQKLSALSNLSAQVITAKDPTQKSVIYKSFLNQAKKLELLDPTDLSQFGPELTSDTEQKLQALAQPAMAGIQAAQLAQMIKEQELKNAQLTGSKTQADIAETARKAKLPIETAHPPGSHITVTDPQTGKVIREYDVPRNPENQGLAEQTAQAWLTANPGKTLVDYQSYLASQKATGANQTFEEATYEDYLKQNPGKSRTDFLKWKSDLGASTGRDPKQVVNYTEEGTQIQKLGILNKETGAISEIKTPGGTTAAPGLTADERNKQSGRALVSKSINAIEDLSKRIITRVGPAQRAEAVKRGAEAVFGTDPEFRTYQDARTALAGNLAVAQQGSRPSDADIKAIWLPLVPDAYRDTSESAAMKWALIKTMSNQDQTAAPKKISDKLIESNMKANPSATRQQIIDALKGQGYQQ